MKTLQNLVTLILIACGPIISAQSISPKPTFPPDEISTIQTQLIEGMISFIESVRPFYERGDSYIQFKVKVLIGNSSVIDRTALPILPPAGEAMLQRAYEYLSKQLSNSSIRKIETGKTIAAALLYTYEYQRDQSKSGVSPEVALFGGNRALLENNPITKASKQKCKWYQLFCHLENAIEWVLDHGEDLVTAISIVITIINFI